MIISYLDPWGNRGITLQTLGSAGCLEQMIHAPPLLFGAEKLSLAFRGPRLFRDSSAVLLVSLSLCLMTWLKGLAGLGV